jgi:hypothetical protein
MIALTGIGAFLAYSHMDAKIKSPEGAALLAIILYIVAERLLVILDISFHERSMDEYKEEAVRLKHAILGSHLEVYIDNADAFSECIKIALQDKVVWVKNTVCRYGGKQVEVTYAHSYEDWIKAKANLLNRGKRVQELFDFYPDGYPLLNLKNSSPKRLLFSGAYLKQEVPNVIQMTIFKYDDGSKEVFFGWDVGGSQYEPVFRSRDQELTEYFTKYFDSLYNGHPSEPLESYHPDEWKENNIGTTQTNSE